MGARGAHAERGPSILRLEMLFATALALAGCASSGGYYAAPPRGTTTATLVKCGSMLFGHMCTSSIVVDGYGRAVQTAFVKSIDDKLVNQIKNSVSVAVGAHRIGLSCVYDLSSAEHYHLTDAMRNFRTVYEVSLDAPTAYYIRAELSGDQCHLWISGTPDWGPLPSLHLVCQEGESGPGTCGGPQSVAGWPWERRTLLERIGCVGAPSAQPRQSFTLTFDT
jgi:hypothetical protein